MTLRIEDIRIGQTLTANCTHSNGNRTIFDGQVVRLHARSEYPVVLRSSDIGRGVPADMDLYVKLEELSLPDPRPIIVGDKVVFHPSHSHESVEAEVVSQHGDFFRVKILAALRESAILGSEGTLHKVGEPLSNNRVAFPGELRRIPGTYPPAKKEPGVFAVGDKVVWRHSRYNGLSRTGVLVEFPSGANEGGFDFYIHNESGAPICAVYISELTHAEG